MHTIQKTVEIKAPVQRVYDFVSQPTNLPGIWPHLVSVSNVAARAGGAYDFDWIYKMAGLHLKGHAKVEDAQPGKILRFRNEGGISSTYAWTFAGLNGSGSRLTLEVEYTMPTPVIGKIAEAITVKLNERDLDGMLANLKDTMEHFTSPLVSAGPPAP